MCNKPLYAYQMTELVTAPLGKSVYFPFGAKKFQHYEQGEYMPVFTRKQKKKKRSFLYCKTEKDWNLLKEREPHYKFTIHKCGQCIQCRLDSSFEWATRIVCEQSLSKSGLFITLTYADENLSLGEKGLPTCHVDHMSTFMKDLRRYCEYHYDVYGIRFYGAQEYGTKTGRPHYHLCVFNLPQQILDDLIQYKVSFDGNIYYNSPILSKIWDRGHVVIADLCFRSAAYVARYVTKKQKGQTKKFYSDLGIEPECARMSNRPGIGREFYERNKSIIYDLSSDCMYLPQVGKVSPAKYFDKLYTFEDPATMEILKGERVVSGTRATLQKKLRTDKSWEEYLNDCEIVLKKRLDKLVRPDL